MNRAVILAMGAIFLSGCGKEMSAGHDHAAMAATKPAASAPKYHCPMHPSYTSDRPGLCPICNMSLVPIEEGGATASGPAVEGRTAVMITPERRRQIGLVTTPVVRKALTRALRATGRLTYDETRLSRISPRVGGWVRELKVNTTGQKVAAGQPLFTLYSPDLLVTEREYLNARASGDQDLLRAARRRLELWEISVEQVAALELSGQPGDTLELRAPTAGVVLTKDVQAGQAIMPGEMLYEIADLSKLWVQAAIPEQDAQLIHTGLTAQITVAGLPDKAFAASVTFISPTVDPTTRSIAVRLELDNAQGELRPDLWADVELELELGEGLVIPASAVIDTGRRLVAFVDAADGAIEPRLVRAQARGEEELLVRDGVAEGERVVTRALFLVDAESQLKAVVANMGESGEGRRRAESGKRKVNEESGERRAGRRNPREEQSR